MSWTYLGPPPPATSIADLPGVSARLTMVATLARTQGAVADIGTDHARLLVAMVCAGWARSGIGIDRAARPLAAARARVAAADLADRIQLRLGSGLGPLAPSEADTVVLAGIGGRTAIEVLNGAGLGARGIRRVVVQPNRDDALLRRHLFAQGWPVCAETLVYDAGRLFYTLAAEPGPARALDPLEMWLGPILRHQRGPLVDAFRGRRKAWLSRRPAPRAPDVEAVLAHLNDG